MFVIEYKGKITMNCLDEYPEFIEELLNEFDNTDYYDRENV